MGRFDGILLCSDIDGTLTYNGKFDEVFEKNKSAIRYFTDNGGKFTLITGRYKSFITKNNLTSVINAPAGIFNGAAVYDYKNDKLLSLTRINHTLCELISAADKMKEYIVRINPVIDMYTADTDTADELVKEDTLQRHPIKVIYVFDTPEHAVESEKYLSEADEFSDCFVSRSWHVGVEIQNAAATKGHAARRIKKLTGAHTLITIGDFENDIPMLKLADIGAAVGSAPDYVKAAADIVVKPCRDGAVSDIIQRIEKSLCRHSTVTL